MKNASFATKAGSSSDTALLSKISEAVRQHGLAGTKAETELRTLSAQPKVDVIEVFADEIRISGHHFEGPATFHVTLHFGEGSESFDITESLPGIFSGTVDGTDVTIEDLQVDTASLFE